MRIILILFSLVLLGCDNESAEELDIHIGDVVKVNSQFYKDCVGIVVHYYDYSSSDDEVQLNSVKCGVTISVNYITVEAKYVTKL